MEQLLQFITHHWVLCSLLVIIILLIIFEELRGRGVRGVQSTSPQQAVQLINRQNALVIDVRSPEAFSGGHIATATNVPAEKWSNADFMISENDRNRSIIVVCQAGQTSLAIAAKLHKQGFQHVHSLTGGITNWKQNTLPLVKGAK